jgi:hypothetical protein
VNTRGAAMEKELEKREKELNAEKRKAAAAANENALLRERLQALEAAGVGGANPTPPPPLPTPPPIPLTQLPFNPAMLATDPQFLAALAAAFRNSGAGGGGSAQPFGGMVPGMPASWPATVLMSPRHSRRQNARTCTESSGSSDCLNLASSTWCGNPWTLTQRVFLRRTIWSFRRITSASS